MFSSVTFFICDVPVGHNPQCLLLSTTTTFFVTVQWSDVTNRTEVSAITGYLPRLSTNQSQRPSLVVGQDRTLNETLLSVLLTDTTFT